MPDPSASEFLVTPAFGTPADGVTSVAIEVRLVNRSGAPIRNAAVALEISGLGNVLQPLAPTDSSGRTSGTLASFAGEEKTILARTGAGGVWTDLGVRSAGFQLIPEATYFVRVSGSDADTGRTPRTAWRTLAHALEQAGPGATIHVGAGIQSGPLSVRHDSRGARPLWIAGDPRGLVTGDAGEVVIEAGGAPFALELRDAHDVVVQGLTLRGSGSGLSIVDSSGVRVFACELAQNDVGLRVEGAQDLVLQDCRVDANRGDGVLLSGTQRARIENNLIYANLGAGLVLGAQATESLVRYNTFYRNGGPHLREETLGGSGKIEENILAEGDSEPVSLPFGSAYQSCANLVWGHSVSRTLRTPSGYLEANPLLANPFGADGILGAPGSSDDDFRLLPQSIAIDLGNHFARDLVLGTQQSLATRTSRVDEVLEGRESDAFATNLGFHPPPDEPAFASIPQGGARLVHAVPGDVRAYPRSWSRTTGTRTSAVPGPLLEATVVFLEQRTSPLATREELLAAQASTGTQGRITVRHWDGRRWNEPALAPFLDGLPLEELGERRFGLEYEALSGRALFVAAGVDGLPSYQILERGGWNVAQPVPGFLAGPRLRWIELVARPNSNELGLVALDDQRDLWVLQWDGSAWSAPRRLEANTLFRPGWRPFDAAYESLSGDLLVAWGFSAFAEETRWASFERASGQWRTGQHPSTDAIGAHIVLASDPTSDRISAALGEADSDNDVTVSVWDGGAWVHTAELTLAGPQRNRLLENTWIGRSGIACVVFRRQGALGCFNVALLQPTGWRIQPDVLLPGVDKAAQVRLASLPDANQMLGLVLDQQGQLFEFRFDGQGFALLEGGQPLATGFDPAAAGRPFDVVTLPASLGALSAP